MQPAAHGPWINIRPKVVRASPRVHGHDDGALLRARNGGSLRPPLLQTAGLVRRPIQQLDGNAPIVLAAHGGHLKPVASTQHHKAFEAVVLRHPLHAGSIVEVVCPAATTALQASRLLFHTWRTGRRLYQQRASLGSSQVQHAYALVLSARRPRVTY